MEKPPEGFIRIKVNRRKSKKIERLGERGEGGGEKEIIYNRSGIKQISIINKRLRSLSKVYGAAYNSCGYMR